MMSRESDARLRSLDPDKISATIERLSRRIEERFPGSGLGAICRQLLSVSQHARGQAGAIGKPMIALRCGVAALIVLIVAGLLATALVMKKPADNFDLAQFIQLLESAINDMLLIGAAVFFLATLENRIKRTRALKALHELRAIAHIIDMHQLTKDPERLLSPAQATASSPQPNMTPFELSRYLDYCSEMLSLTGKIAALYIQHFDDAVAIGVANEIEALTTGLSNKIWQKLTVLHALKADEQGRNRGDGASNRN